MLVGVRTEGAQYAEPASTTQEMHKSDKLIVVPVTMIFGQGEREVESHWQMSSEGCDIGERQCFCLLPCPLQLQWDYLLVVHTTRMPGSNSRDNARQLTLAAPSLSVRPHRKRPVLQSPLAQPRHAHEHCRTENTKRHATSQKRAGCHGLDIISTAEQALQPVS